MKANLFIALMLIFAPTGQSVCTPEIKMTIGMQQDEVGLVAFSVGRKDSFSPRESARIMMDTEWYNDEGHFNMTTGAFTAPHTGLYAFFYGAAGIKGHGPHLFLLAGDWKVSVAYSSANNGYNMASGSVFVKLPAGREVSLWLYSANGAYEVNGYDPPSTHFNGYLVKAMK